MKMAGHPVHPWCTPPDPPQRGEPLDRQAVGRAGELGINLVSAGQEKREL
jgi:hypothetical protein